VRTLRVATFASLIFLLLGGEGAFARCIPDPASPAGWRIQDNPTVTVRYRVRDGVKKCQHPIWEELARQPYEARVVSQPQNGRAFYNPGFRSFDFEWKTPVIGATWKARVCGEMYGQKGCATITYIYSYE
jgi:hypothetical protein